MKGRKPKPSIIKISEGNPGKRKLPANEPKPVPSIPDCPSHLKGESKLEWERVTTELFEQGLLTRLDRTVLATYCETYGIWVEASTNVVKRGRVIPTQNGYPVLNPWHSIATKAALDLKAFAVEFGLTPSSRSRIAVEKAETLDPLTAFMQKRNA